MKKFLQISPLILLLNFLLPISGFAQKEANIWYFGANAGVDFNPTSPIALLDGAISTNEGTSSICDPNGNLQFYTDGVTVYNRMHNVMPNGIGLKGSFTSTQSALIVPDPYDSTLFYIFTTQPESSTNEFNYSIVDMSLNGGLGDIDIGNKNILIHSPVGEKVTAAKHQNSQDIWIITHEDGTNNYLCYLLNGSGLNTTPVISSVGAIFDHEAGAIKSSSNSQRIASAVLTGIVEICDFDNATGLVSNPILIDSVDFAYGIEFSPSSCVLYFTSITTGLYQVDLNAGTASDVISSKTLIHFDSIGPVFIYEALQLASNGKIYVCIYNTDKLSVIDNPNSVGISCSYMHKTFDLSGRVTVTGLPNFPPYFFNNIATTLNLDICVGDSVFAGGSYQTTSGTYYDTLTATNSCDSIIITNLNVLQYFVININSDICAGDSAFAGDSYQTTSGTYYDTLISANGCDSIVITNLTLNSLPMAFAKPDTTIVSGGNVQLSGAGGSGYSWSPASSLSCTNCQNPVANPTETTTYYLTVADTNNCININSVTIRIIIEETVCDDNTIFIPDIFSPNGDYNNDVLYVMGDDFEIIEFVIYDRWGERVFETNDINQGWDGTYRGKILNPAVFVYYLEAICNNENVVKKGNITLIR